MSKTESQPETIVHEEHRVHLREETGGKLWQRHQVLLMMLIPLKPIRETDLLSLIYFFQKEISEKKCMPITLEALNRQMKALARDKLIRYEGIKIALTPLGRDYSFYLQERLSEEDNDAWGVTLRKGRTIFNETNCVSFTPPKKSKSPHSLIKLSLVFFTKLLIVDYRG